MVPVGDPGQDGLVEIAQDRLEGLAVLGRRGRELRANLSRGDRRRDRQLAHAFEVPGDPVERRLAVAAKVAHCFFISFLTSRQGRAFTICSGPIQPRLA
jgi:hypothetical protein